MSDELKTVKSELQAARDELRTVRAAQSTYLAETAQPTITTEPGQLASKSAQPTPIESVSPSPTAAESSSQPTLVADPAPTLPTVETNQPAAPTQPTRAIEAHKPGAQSEGAQEAVARPFKTLLPFSGRSSSPVSSLAKVEAPDFYLKVKTNKGRPASLLQQ